MLVVPKQSSAWDSPLIENVAAVICVISHLLFPDVPSDTTCTPTPGLQWLRTQPRAWHSWGLCAPRRQRMQRFRPWSTRRTCASPGTTPPTSSAASRHASTRTAVSLDGWQEVLAHERAVSTSPTACIGRCMTSKPSAIHLWADKDVLVKNGTV